MSRVRTLRLADASVHATKTADAFELAVITSEGVQVAIGITGLELEALAFEARDLLTGDAMAFHRAGVRVSKRLQRITSK